MPGSPHSPLATPSAAVHLDRAPGRVLHAAPDARTRAHLEQAVVAALPGPHEALRTAAGGERASAAGVAPGSRLQRLTALLREKGLVATTRRALARRDRRRRAAARAVARDRAWSHLTDVRRRAPLPRRMAAACEPRGGPLVVTVGASSSWAACVPEGAVWLDASIGAASGPADRRGLEWALYHRDLGELVVEVTAVSPGGRPVALLDRRPVSLRPGDGLAEIRVRSAIVAVDALVDAAAALFRSLRLDADPLPAHASLATGRLPDAGLLDVETEIERDLERGLLTRLLVLRSRF